MVQGGCKTSAQAHIGHRALYSLLSRDVYERRASSAAAPSSPLRPIEPLHWRSVTKGRWGPRPTLCGKPWWPRSLTGPLAETLLSDDLWTRALTARCVVPRHRTLGGWVGPHIVRRRWGKGGPSGGLDGGRILSHGESPTWEA